VLIAVDNTTATAYLQQPLALGANYVVASDTKALTGHSDLVLGHVATADPEQATALRTWRTQHGAIRTQEVWLAHRSLATLAVAFESPVRICATARPLSGGPSLCRGRFYPGLPDHAAHEIAKRQMKAFGASSVSTSARVRAPNSS